MPLQQDLGKEKKNKHDKVENAVLKTSLCPKNLDLMINASFQNSRRLWKRPFLRGQDLTFGSYWGYPTKVSTVQTLVKSGCSFLPPENTFVLPLLKARQKILEWCSPFSWTGLTLEWMASSICQSKTRRSSPPRGEEGNITVWDTCKFVIGKLFNFAVTHGRNPNQH